jgi:hypothetical protein
VAWKGWRAMMVFNVIERLPHQGLQATKGINSINNNNAVNNVTQFVMSCASLSKPCSPLQFVDTMDTTNDGDSKEGTPTDRLCNRFGIILQDHQSVSSRYRRDVDLAIVNNIHHIFKNDHYLGELASSIDIHQILVDWHSRSEVGHKPKPPKCSSRVFSMSDHDFEFVCKKYGAISNEKKWKSLNGYEVYPLAKSTEIIDDKNAGIPFYHLGETQWPGGRLVYEHTINEGCISLLPATFLWHIPSSRAYLF